MGSIHKSVASVLNVVDKIGGSGLKMPKELTSLSSVMSKAASDSKAMSDALAVIAKQGAAMEKAGKTVDAALESALKVVAKDNFGLDPKSPDAKKKLDAIRKELTTRLTAIQKDVDQQMTSFGKLDTAVASANKSAIA